MLHLVLGQYLLVVERGCPGVGSLGYAKGRHCAAGVQVHVLSASASFVRETLYELLLIICKDVHLLVDAHGKGPDEEPYLGVVVH